jgi:hypothetical protein
LWIIRTIDMPGRIIADNQIGRPSARSGNCKLVNPSRLDITIPVNVRKRG